MAQPRSETASPSARRTASRGRTSRGPHPGGPVMTFGAPLDQAPAAMILLHGRGATAANILSLAKQFDRPEIAYLAPQAAGNSWYPYSFLARTRGKRAQPVVGVADDREFIGAKSRDTTFPPRKFFWRGSRRAPAWRSNSRPATRGVTEPDRLSGGFIGPPGLLAQLQRLARRYTGLSWLWRHGFPHSSRSRRGERPGCFTDCTARSSSASTPEWATPSTKMS